MKSRGREGEEEVRREATGEIKQHVSKGVEEEVVYLTRAE